MEGTFNVVTKGADPTGSLDSRESIQATIDDAHEAGGGIVFFPPGEYLTSIHPSNGIAFRIYPRVSLVGHNSGITEIRLIENAGDYRAIIGQFDTDSIDDMRIAGLKFNANAQNNPYIFEGDLPSPANARLVMAFWIGNRIEINRCAFTNIDATGVISFNGVLSDILISKNTFNNIGGPNDHDHSSIYVDARGDPGDGVWVYGNSIRASSPGALGARTGIELHGSGIFADGNFVVGMGTGAIIAGISDCSEGMIFRNNQLHNVQHGILIYSMQHPEFPDVAVGLRDCIIDGNVIGINHDIGIFAYGRGIATAPYNQLSIENLSVSHNLIRFLPCGRTHVVPGSEGIAILDNPTSHHKNWRIVDNEIVDCPTEHVQIVCEIENLKVWGNS